MEIRGGKLGTMHHLLVDRNGVPPIVALSGAITTIARPSFPYSTALGS